MRYNYKNDDEIILNYQNMIDPIFIKLKYELIEYKQKSIHQNNQNVNNNNNNDKKAKKDEKALQFTKYEKMAHSSVKHNGKMNGKYAVTEKVHGANFSILCSQKKTTNSSSNENNQNNENLEKAMKMKSEKNLDKNENDVSYNIQYARRTGIISDDDDFYGYLSYKIPERYNEKIKQVYKLVHNYYRTLYQNKLNKQHQNNKNDIDEDEVEQISVIGELFGGYYPETNKNNFGPVQTGIWYTNDIEFIVFDLAVTFKSGHRQYLHFQQCKDFIENCGFYFVPILFIGNYEDAINYPIEFDSKIPELLKMSPLPLNSNLAEGVVIKSCIENENSSFKYRVIFKQKIEEFSEKKYQTSRTEFKNNLKNKYKNISGEGRGRGAEEMDETSEIKGETKAHFLVKEEEKKNMNIDLLKYEMFACLTTSRLEGVQSKIGIINFNQVDECLLLLKSFIQDIISDLNDEEKIIFDSLDTNERKVLLCELRKEAKNMIASWAASFSSPS